MPVVGATNSDDTRSICGVPLVRRRFYPRRPLATTSATKPARMPAMMWAATAVRYNPLRKRITHGPLPRPLDHRRPPGPIMAIGARAEALDEAPARHETEALDESL